jgi:NTE family protein
VKAKAQPKRVALALGSGGARGYAHIGVIDAVLARGWQIIGVAGSSMGAVVGGLYVAGGLPAYREWVGNLSRRDVVRLLDPAMGGGGLVKATKVMEHVRRHIGDITIEEAALPYTAIAVDLISQREVWFTSGPMIDAMRASFAIPSVFTPVVTKGMVLADGGLLNPVPVVPLADLHADAIIAVNLAGPPLGDKRDRAAVEVPAPELARGPRLRLPGLPSIVDAPLRALLPGPKETRGEKPAMNVTTVEVVDRSLHLMQTAVRRYRLAGFPPDVLIDIPSDVCGTMDFHRANEVIAVGRARADAALDAWDGGTVII